MDGLEFYISADEVWYKDVEGMHVLRENSPAVDIIIDKIQELFPLAYEALCECYEKSRANNKYFKYLIARRFCKCNFGNLDFTRTDVSEGTFNLERIPCPLMGECKYECVICMPQMESFLSDAEKRVMKLVCDGKSNQEIADELYLSPNTVRRHISMSYFKTNTHNRAEFVSYAKDNSIFS